MMRYRIRAMFVFLLANVIVHLMVAQPSTANTEQEKYLSEPIQPQRFNDQNWQKSIEGLDYYIKRKKPPKQRKPKKIEPFQWPALGNAILTLLKVLVIAILAVIVALLLRHYLNAPKNIAVKATKLDNLSIEEIEENLEETELTPYIRKAIDANDYTLAIRLYYLELLKQLSAQGAIHWRKNKTNRQYLQEMRVSKRYTDFKLLTLIFERVCYGGQHLSKPDFEQIEPNFHAFLKSTNSAVFVPPPVETPI